MDDIVTSDLSEFGYRELKEAARLLTAYTESGKPDFLEGKVQIYMNKNSGCVFLCDEDYNTGMMNGDRLEQWFNCPYCGHEGFKQDMKHAPKDEDCTSYLEDIGVIDKEASK